MLKELARQLEVAGRNTKEIKMLSEDIINESSTWQLLCDILENKDTDVEPVDIESAMYSEVLASNSIYFQNEELRHLKAVLNWLESEALQNCDKNPYTDLVTPENTFHK